MQAGLLAFSAVAVVPCPQDWTTRDVSQGSHLSQFLYEYTLGPWKKICEWMLTALCVWVFQQIHIFLFSLWQFIKVFT